MATEGQDVAVSTLVKYSVFVGIFLTHLLDCVPWIWGNLSVYVISYFHAHGDEFATGLNNWFIMINATTFNVGVLIAGSLGRKIGDITTMFLAILLYNGGLFASYASLDYSAKAFCATFGGITGFCGGIIQSTQCVMIVRWTKKYDGLATSTVSSSTIFLSTIVNLAITWYINPNNLQPNSTIDRIAIFTQKDLINMVPATILIYSILSTVVNMTGFLLLRDRPGCRNIFSEIIKFFKVRIFAEKLTNSDTEKTPALQVTNGSLTSSGAHNVDETLYHQIHDNGDSTITDNESTIQESASSSDVTPREALKRKDFYSSCFFLGVQSYAVFVLGTYYKTFGLLYIPDDHFLTTVGVINGAFTPVCAWVAGFFMDKYGAKPTTIVMSSLFCVMASLFYLSPVNKWLYLVSCMLYGGSVFPLFCITISCFLKMFGPTYFTSILGMALTSNLVLTFAVPPLAGWIMAAYGWFVLFISVAVLAFVNVLVLVWGLPE